MRGASAKYYRLAKRHRPRFQFSAFVVIYTIGSFWAVAETGTRFYPQFGVDGGNWADRGMAALEWECFEGAQDRRIYGVTTQADKSQSAAFRPFYSIR